MKTTYSILAAALIFSLNIDSSYPQLVATAESPINYENASSSGEFSTPSFENGYYLIAGVFSINSNANAFYLDLREKGLNPSMYSSSVNEKIYVCLGQSQSVDLLKEKLQKIRANKELKNTWIMKFSDNKESKITTHSIIEKKNSNEVVKLEKNRSKKRDLSETHYNYQLYINIHNGNNVPVQAKIKIINGEEAKVISTVPSNKPVSLDYPKQENQNVQLSCEVFGFHKTTFDLNLQDPINEVTLNSIRKSGDTIFINMPLEKYQRGDIMVMYNVFFFPNSNAIRQKSNYELQRLLTLFKENPELKVTIHGHTNGSSLGEIIKIKEDSCDLFSIQDPTVKFGTAKNLSKLRSKTIKRYLIANGIAEDRIKIKGWGGRKMIHKENSPMAEYNVRVEVEVLED